MDSYSMYKELLVSFAGSYVFDCKSTWHLYDGYDIICINGNGSRISVSTGDKDEEKWAHLEDSKCTFSVSDLTIEGFNMGIENLGCICILNNIKFNNNRMDYSIERDYGAGICNSGTSICINCSFTNNYCKYGGAIFSQGRVEIFNCTFMDNKAYGDGDDICNLDNGIVIIDGVQINGTDGIVYHLESMSKSERTWITSLAPFLAAAIGFTIGTICGGPVLGAVLGGLAGACVGTAAATYICSKTYDLTFNRGSLCALLIVECTVAGALGGLAGGYITAAPAEAGQGVDLISEHVYYASSSESSSLISETSSSVSSSLSELNLDGLHLTEELLEELLGSV